MAQASLKVGGDNWLYKKESLMAYNDENGNFKPAPFEFSRASGATRVNGSGFIESVQGETPRINYDINDAGQVSSKGHLLLEPTRSNKVNYSEDFNQWELYQQTSLSSGDSPEFMSPSGLNDAFKLVSQNTFDYHQVRLSVPFSVTETISMFAKPAGYDFIVFRQSTTGFGYRNACFDLKNGTVGTIQNGFSNANIDYYGNGWYRVSVAITNRNALNLQVLMAPRDNSELFTGDGVSGIYIYGAQVEAGSYATSYIPTNGSAVTRTDETCQNAGLSNVFNPSEGVFLVETSSLSDDLTSRDIVLSDGPSQSNFLRIGYTFNSNDIRVTAFSNNTQIFNLSHDIGDIISNTRILIKYKSSDYSIWVNGFKIYTDSSAAVPIILSNLSFKFPTSNTFYGKTKQIKTYNTALTDAELETLTSWTSFNELANELLYTIR